MSATFSPHCYSCVDPYIIFRHVSLRIINLHTSETTVEELDFNWDLVQNHPLIYYRNNNSLSLSYRKSSHKYGLKHFLTLINLSQKLLTICMMASNPSHLLQTMEFLRKTINPRKDFVIFHTSKHISENIKNVLSIPYRKSIFATNINSHQLLCAIIMEVIKTRNGAMSYFLEGRHLKASTYSILPYIYKSYNNDLVDTPAGLHFRILQQSSQQFNFTFQIDFETSSTLHPNGTWTGIYSRIFYPDSGYDFIMFLSLDNQRFPVGDRSAITKFDAMTFAISNPSQFLHWYSIFLPFQFPVWILSMVMFLAISTVLVASIMVRNSEKNISRRRRLIFDVGTIFPFAITMDQAHKGLQQVPNEIKFPTFLFLLGCTLLGTGYRATLRKHLMFPKPEAIPYSFSDLARADDYSITICGGERDWNFFNQSSTPEFQILYSRAELGDYYACTLNCLERAVVGHKIACVAWDDFMIPYARISVTLNSSISSLIYSQNVVLSCQSAFGFQENSIFVDSFDEIIWNLNDMGILSKLWDEDDAELKRFGRGKMLQTSENANSSRNSQELFKALLKLSFELDERKPMTVENLLVVLAVIPVGCLMAISAFGWECQLLQKMSTCRSSVL